MKRLVLSLVLLIPLLLTPMVLFAQTAVYTKTFGYEAWIDGDSFRMYGEFNVVIYDNATGVGRIEIDFSPPEEIDGYIPITEGYFYAIYTGGSPIDVYTFNGTTWTKITIYFWNANTSYIIFKAPKSGLVYINKTSSDTLSNYTENEFLSGDEPSSYSLSISIRYEDLTTGDPVTVICLSGCSIDVSRTLIEASYNGTNIIVNGIWYNASDSSHTFEFYAYQSISWGYGHDFRAYVEISTDDNVRLFQADLVDMWNDHASGWGVYVSAFNSIYGILVRFLQDSSSSRCSELSIPYMEFSRKITVPMHFVAVIFQFHIWNS